MCVERKVLPPEILDLMLKILTEHGKFSPMTSKMDEMKSPIRYEEYYFCITKTFLLFSWTKIFFYSGLKSLTAGEYVVYDLIHLNSKICVPES